MSHEPTPCCGTTHAEALNAAFWAAFETRQRHRVWRNRVTGMWDWHTLYEPVHDDPKLERTE